MLFNCLQAPTPVKKPCLETIDPGNGVDDPEPHNTTGAHSNNNVQVCRIKVITFVHNTMYTHNIVTVLQSV